MENTIKGKLRGFVGKALAILLAAALVLLVVVASVLQPSDSQDAFADQVNTVYDNGCVLNVISDSDTIVNDDNMLTMDYTNVGTIEWAEGVDGLVINNTSYNVKQIEVTCPDDISEDWTVNDGGDICTITFENAATLGDRKIDALVTLSNAQFSGSTNSSDTDNTYAELAYIWTADEGGLSIGSKGASWDTAYRYFSQYSVDVEINIVWSDTQETVELPFFMAISDIDLYDNDSTVEGWESGSGFTNEFYVYSTNQNTITETENGLKFAANSTTNTNYSGTNSYTKCGVYAPTNTGIFKSTFYEHHSASKIEVYSSYSTFETEVNPDKTASPYAVGAGDEVVWDVDVTMPVWDVEIYDALESFVWTDELPDGIDFESATLTDDEGTTLISIDLGDSDATAISSTVDDVGTLAYDNGTLTLTFDEDWLTAEDGNGDCANYDGGTLTLSIATTATEDAGIFVADSDGNYGETVNEVTVAIDGLEYTATAEIYAKGYLAVKNVLKEVDGYADWDKDFAYTVTIGGLDEEALDGDYDYSVTDSDGSVMYGTLTAVDGVLSFTLEGGQMAAIDLPEGATYEVAQTDYSNYTTTYENESGTISTGWSTATFTNAINTYTVSYDANATDATGSISSQSGVYGSLVSLSDGSGFSRPGYSFAGWNTAADGTGTDYAAGGVLYLTQDVTLYAQWEPKDVIPDFEAQSYVYDGQAQSFVTSGSGLSGFSVGYTDAEGATVESPTEAGSYDVGIARDEDEDYAAFSQRLSGGLTITKATPTVAVSDLVVSYGEEYSVSATVTGVDGEIEGAELTYAYYSDAACTEDEMTTAPTAAGTYYVKASYAGSDNYTEADGVGTLVILDSAFSFTVTSDDSVYDGEGHGITVSTEFDGDGNVTPTVEVVYRDEEGEEVVDESGAACEPVDAGEYTADFTISVDNYATVTGSTTVLITPATPAVTASDVEATYDGTNHTVTTWSVAGVGVDGVLASSDDEESTTVSISYYDNEACEGDALASAPTDAGTWYALVSYSSDDGNYTDASCVATVTIAPASQSISFAKESVSAHVSDSSVAENALSGAQTAVSYGSSDESVVTVSSDGTVTIVAAGTATITATAAETDNYEAAAASYTITVSDHSYGEGVVTTEPTCTEEGVKTYPCTYDGCGATCTEPVDATGHDWDYEDVTWTWADDYSSATATITCKNDGSHTASATDTTIAVSYTEGGTIVSYAAAVTIEGEDLDDSVSLLVDGLGEGWEGVYDGASHSISVPAPEGATVTYATSEDGEYSEENPAYSDVGSYTVYYKVSLEGYEDATGSAEVVITKATLTATYAGETITYGDDPVLAVSVTGFVNGESADDAEGYVAPTLATDASAAGSYELTPSGGDAANYSFEYVSGTLVILNADFSFSAQGYSGVYDGDGHSITLTFPDGATVLYSEDGETWTSENPSYTDAGEYTVYFSISLANHNDVTGSSKVTISKATPTVSASDVTATYDGSEHPVTEYAVTGVGDELSDASVGISYVDASGNEVEEPVDAGSYTATISYAGSDNYNSASATATVGIAKATPTVTATDVSATYDGQAHPVTDYAVTGVGDELSAASVTIGYVDADGNAATPVDVGTYTATVSWAGSDNYAAASCTATVTISTTTSSIEAKGVTAVYDGDAHPVTEYAVTGAEGAELSGGVTIVYTDEDGNAVSPVDAGTYTATVTFAGDANHTGCSTTATVTISKATPAVAAEDVAATYDGGAHPVTDYSVAGVGDELDGAAISISYVDSDGNAVDEPVDAGTYTATVSYAGSGNYEAAEATATVTISKATPTLEAEDVSATYDGEGHPVTEYALTGVGDELDEAAVSVSYADADGDAVDEPVDAGEYTATLTWAGSGNYEAAEATATVTISKATPTLTAGDVSAVYDGEAHPVEYELTGVGSELEDAEVTVSYVDAGGSTVSGGPVGAGTYTATIAWAGDDNYEAASTTATVTIAKATAALTASDLVASYDGEAHDVSYELTGIGDELEAEEAEIGYVDENGNEVDGSPVDAGTYTATVSWAGSTNYEAAEAEATLVIVDSQFSFSVEGWTGVYDGEAHGIAVEAPEGAEVSVSYTDADGNAVEGEPVDAGTYTASFTIACENYSGVSASTTVRISKAAPSLTADDVEAVYDGEGHGVEYALAGVGDELDGAEVSVVYTDEEGEEVEGEPVDAGTYTAAISYAGSGNYEAASCTATVTIAKASQALSFEDDSVEAHVSDSSVAENALSGAQGEVSYSSSDESVATVDASTGEVTIAGAGTATITATAAETDNYEAAAASYAITVSDHSWGEGVVTTEPTCTEEGVATYTCSYEGCGATYTEPVEATGHDWDYRDVEWTWADDHGSATATVTCRNDGGHSDSVGAEVTTRTTDATCTEAGSVVYTATATLGDGSTVSESVTVAIEATGHSAGDPVVENEAAATCTEDGSYDAVVYCDVCGEELSRETVAVEAAGHSWDGGEVTEPTCTEGGYTTWTCTVCGETYTGDETLALGHTAGEPVVSDEVEPTCTEDGSHTETVYCTVCGIAISSEEVTDPATGHAAGEAVVEDEVEPTCTEDGGYDTVTYCTVCGAEVSREATVVPATGHDYGAEVVEPTCTEAGCTTYTCSVCGDSYTGDEVDATGHDWGYDEAVWTWSDDLSAATAAVACANDSSHVQTVEAEVSSETTEATCNDSGATTYTAAATFEDGTVLTDTVTVAIDATGHDYDWEAVEWTWTESEDGEVSCAASVPCAAGDDTLLVDPEVTSETVEATCEEDGSTTYTATVADGEGNEYTDSYSVSTPATGHDWNCDDIEWSWSDDLASATATVVCSNDESHTLTVDAVVASEPDGDGGVTFTATAEIDGGEYTDSVSPDKFLFIDVEDPDAYYFESVYALYYMGYVTGYNDTVYGVNDNMTRAEFVTILWRIEGKPDAAEGAIDFEDVEDGKYYSQAVAWASSNSVVNGYSDEEFGPTDPITFEQACAVIARYEVGGIDAVNSLITDGVAADILAEFADGDEVSAWADNAMAWCVREGIVEGEISASGEPIISPLEDIARERAATILARWQGLVDPAGA